MKETSAKSPTLAFDPPKLIPPSEKGGPWTLAEDWSLTYLGNPYVIPSGFYTDGASIPCVLRPICGDPLEVPRLYAAIVHDYMYMTHAMPRDLADDLYLDLLLALDIPPLKACVEYVAIRLCGWLHWGK